MYETRQSNELALCPDCRVASHECDRFCRQCGVALGERTRMLDAAEQATAELHDAPSPYATAPLTALPARRSVSAPLVNLVMAELPTLQAGGWMRPATLVLISLPIWLMMILLSPFDAYAATKALAQRV